MLCFDIGLVSYPFTFSGYIYEYVLKNMYPYDVNQMVHALYFQHSVTCG